MYWIRSRNGLLTLLLAVVVIASTYKLFFFSSHVKNNHGNKIKQVRIQKTNSFEKPCLCNEKYTDLSTEPSIFQSDVFPDEECCLPSVGNGFVATVVYSDRIHMNGLYNGYKGNSLRARIPSTAAIQFHVKDNSSMVSELFTLDVKQGVFTRVTELKNVIIEQRIYAHQNLTRLIINEVTISHTPGGGMSDFVLSVSNNTGPASEDINFQRGSPPQAGVEYMYGRTKKAETNTSGTLSAHVYWTLMPSNITLPSSQTSHTWTFITSISNSSSDALSYFMDGLKAAKAGTLFDTHADIWLKKWNEGSIDIDQDLPLAKAIYGSMYYILSSLPPLKEHVSSSHDFTFYGLSPGSLADGGNVERAYQGHVFWDQETWMYPPIMLFHPTLAKRMLMSRIMHMEAAADMARKNGYEGLKFPWEMAYSGYEVCPAPPYSSNELHINGDIALALQQYVHLTSDMDFLTKQSGLDLAVGLAKFWASKAQYDAQTDTYSIRNVMGPDEYHQNVSNSVYTNTVAQISLRLPSMLAKKSQLKVSDKWLDIADKLVIPFDKKRNYYPEFEGYMIGTRIKQADAIMLGYPLMRNMSKTVRQNDLLFYDVYNGYHVTDLNGPAMTWSMFVIGWLELGNISKAEESFKKSFLNLQQPYKIWTEEATGFGAVNFITGMGGFLQSIIYGYGGFRIQPESLDFNFTLPSTSSQFNITGIAFLGSKLDFRATGTNVLINKTSSCSGAVDLEASVAGRTFALKTGQPVIFDRKPGLIRQMYNKKASRRQRKRKQKMVNDNIVARSS